MIKNIKIIYNFILIFYHLTINDLFLIHNNHTFEFIKEGIKMPADLIKVINKLEETQELKPFKKSTNFRTDLITKKRKTV